jgi:hypothetical protein
MDLPVFLQTLDWLVVLQLQFSNQPTPLIFGWLRFPLLEHRINGLRAVYMLYLKTELPTHPLLDIPFLLLSFLIWIISHNEFFMLVMLTFNFEIYILFFSDRICQSIV